jgi:transcriptional regulator with XRE-family HTH domain
MGYSVSSKPGIRHDRQTRGVPSPLRISFARLCRDTRVMLDITQAELAAAVGVSRAYVASIESGRANPSLVVVERIAEALGLELQLNGRAPVAFNSPTQRDAVHAWCSGYAGRRLGGFLEVRREVTIVRGRTRGWIDLLAYDPRRRLLLVVEIKTWIDDLGSIERQLDWYEREAPSIARGFGWRPVHTIGWVLALASADVDEALRRNRDAVERAFPGRARDLARVLAGDDELPGRGIALMDPRSRRRNWLIPSRIDGRRTAAPYLGMADARAVMSGGGTDRG